MTDLLVAVGLVFVLEGLIWALFPGAGRAMLAAAAGAPESQLRILGTLAVAVGVGIVWFVRGSP
ncbi:MAG: DUF2065 domain-containing protein [Pseudomonadota bacterium]